MAAPPATLYNHECERGQDARVGSAAQARAEPHPQDVSRPRQPETELIDQRCRPRPSKDIVEPTVLSRNFLPGSDAPRAASGFSYRQQESLIRKSALETRLRAAEEKVVEGTSALLLHARFCVLGLTTILVIRCIYCRHGGFPASTVFGLHVLSASCDLISAAFMAMLIVSGLQGWCVHSVCLGPLVTMSLMTLLVDLSAFLGCLAVRVPRPTRKSPSYEEHFRSYVDFWLCVLCASVALHLATCVTCWRVYREMRMSGLYPPGTDALEKENAVSDVSLLEVVCEAEDVELLADCDTRPDDTDDTLRCLPLCVAQPKSSSTPTTRPRERGEFEEGEQEEVPEQIPVFTGRGGWRHGVCNPEHSQPEACAETVPTSVAGSVAAKELGERDVYCPANYAVKSNVVDMRPVTPA